MCTDKKLIERELRKRKSERMINVSIEWSVCFVDRFECDTSIHSLQTQQKKVNWSIFVLEAKKNGFFANLMPYAFQHLKRLQVLACLSLPTRFVFFFICSQPFFVDTTVNRRWKLNKRIDQNDFTFLCWIIRISYHLLQILFLLKLRFGNDIECGKAMFDDWEAPRENHTSLSLFTWIGVLFVCEIVVIFAVVHSLIFTTFRRPRRVFTFFCRNCENTAHYSSFFFCSAYLVLLLFVVVLFCWYSLLVFLYSFHFHSIVMCTHLHFEHEKSISKYLLRMYYCLNVICFYLSLPLSLSFVFLFACDVANTRLLR